LVEDLHPNLEVLGWFKIYNKIQKSGLIGGVCRKEVYYIDYKDLSIVKHRQKGVRNTSLVYPFFEKE
jgi:hypothetical protein